MRRVSACGCSIASLPTRSRAEGAAALAQVDFYQLGGGAAIERVLPRLAERVLEGGARLLVVSADAAQLDMLDRCLWSYRVDSFLPHGRAGEDDAEQPVLLSGEMVAANGAQTVAVVDGTWRDEALGFDRSLHLFDEAGLDQARAAWRALAAANVARSYWRHEDGRWTKVAEERPAA